MNKTYTIYGWDQFNNPIIQTIPAPIPSLYFWLGRDSYPEPKHISKITIDEKSAKPSPPKMQTQKK